MSARGRDRLLLYATPPHECTYLDGSQAVTVFADPEHPKSAWLYGALANQGFRRSGQHLYRPQCPSCDACVSVRVPVAAFTPNRSQRRTWKRNGDLEVRVREQCFSEEHYALYARYVVDRHPGGGMDRPSPEKYREFLLCEWSDTLMVEFRLEGALLAVAVCDQLPDGISAVYTFFDVAHARRALGVHAVLWQIERARACDLDWVYLGYWIRDCDKMTYKAQYLPQQRFVRGAWRAVARPCSGPAAGEEAREPHCVAKRRCGDG